jgi:hypothetical protein
VVPPDNVVLTQLASDALRSEFLGWQCRLRQLAVREDRGRPSAGMRPRVTTGAGEELAPSIVTLIVEAEPQASTEQFRYQYLKTADPNERYDQVLEILQGSYFQQPARFSGVLTALFAPGSPLAARLVRLERCVLHFEQTSQGFRLPARVARVAPAHPLYQATFWHNRLFNEHLPGEPEVLTFTPDWAHAAGFPPATQPGR